MKIFPIIKILLIFVFLVLLVLGGVTWYNVAPVWDELKEKDPGKFQSMVSRARHLNLLATNRLYKELKGMTYEEVLKLRYEIWKEKKETDKKFRLAHWDNELVLREEHKGMKKLERHKLQQELEELQQKNGAPGDRKNWEKTGAWEKGLLLRENCIKFFSFERRDSKGRSRAHHLSDSAALLETPGDTPLPVPTLCERLVPISHDAQVVETALVNLRNRMNYFYFTKMLEEIGIPKKKIFAFESKLDRMTGAFAGS